MILVFGMSACAHKSKVQPSKGHIDGQNTPASQAQTRSSAAKPSVAASIPKPVTNSIYLPPPKPKAKEQTYSIVVYDTPVKEVLFAIARDSKLNVDIHPSIQGRVTLNAVDQTLPAILERLSKQVDITYKLENNTLTIRPDSPFLKSYAVNYVNMNRDTTGEISVSNQIASSVSSPQVGSTGQQSNTNNTEGNTSKTKVESSSKNHFWDSLIQNVTDILAESDKEVLVNRLGTDSRLSGLYDAKSSGKGTAGVNLGARDRGAAGSGDQNVEGSAEESSEKNLKNYKTLFAAAVIPNKETGVLSVRATQRQHEKIQEFLDRVHASAKRQVLIEASIVEIKLNDRYQAGVDWSRLGSGGILDGFTFQQNLLGTALTAAPAVAIGYNKATALGDLAASVRLLQTFGTTKVLSSPKLMVLNSQTAILKAVDNLVYFTVETTPAILGTAGSILSPAITTTTPHTIPVGIWMSVTPQINDNGVVTINVRPTISRQSGQTRDPNPDLKLPSFIPQITVREMESMLQVPSGSTVILGGLMQDEISDNTNGIPGLSNVPVIGNAFKAKDENNTKTELVIFLRPTVISNASLESEELATYKQYLPSQQLEKTLQTDDER
jgi:general secretion pathway protein D